MDAYALPAATHIAYAHLRVADLERALAFYHDLLGLRVITVSDSSAALSATGVLPPLIVLEAHPGARPRPPRTTGLYHVAIRLPEIEPQRGIGREFLEVAPVGGEQARDRVGLGVGHQAQARLPLQEVTLLLLADVGRDEEGADTDQDREQGRGGDDRGAGRVHERGPAAAGVWIHQPCSLMEYTGA